MSNDKHVLLIVTSVLSVICGIYGDRIRSNQQRSLASRDAYYDDFFPEHVKTQAQIEAVGRRRRSECTAPSPQELCKAYKNLQSSAKRFLKLAYKVVGDLKGQEGEGGELVESSSSSEKVHEGRRKTEEDEDYEEDESGGEASTAAKLQREPSIMPTEPSLAPTEPRETSPALVKQVTDERIKLQGRKRRRKSRRNRVTMEPLSDEAVLKLLEVFPILSRPRNQGRQACSEHRGVIDRPPPAAPRRPRILYLSSRRHR